MKVKFFAFCNKACLDSETVLVVFTINRKAIYIPDTVVGDPNRWADGEEAGTGCAVMSYSDTDGVSSWRSSDCSLQKLPLCESIDGMC